jgi:hypothetical protein
MRGKAMTLPSLVADAELALSLEGSPPWPAHALATVSNRN